MPKYKVVDIDMKDVGQLDLADEVFAARANKALLHEVVRATLANRRVGCASTKTRAEVKCSNKKPYRQKGTGRARHGTYASPLFVGGGITFGPRPRDYTIRMPRKKKQAALKVALSLKVKDFRLLVLDKWVEKKKTKEMAALLRKMNVGSALIVLPEASGWLERVVGNIPRIDVTYAGDLNAYNIIAHDYLICTTDVVGKIQEGFNS